MGCLVPDENKGVYRKKMLLNLIIFLAVLSVLIISHEFGHFIAARRSAIKVERFAIGFGPPVIRWQLKETLLLVCLVPLGGYVKLAGDVPDEHKGQPHEFLSKPPGIKARVVFFGPLFNYFLAFLIFWVIFVIGFPYTAPVIGEIVAGTPAARSSLELQDEILAVNGRDIETWRDVTDTIRSSSGEVRLRIRRENQIKDIAVTPQIEVRKDVFGKEREFAFVGIAPSFEQKIIRTGIFPGFLKAFRHLIELTTMIVKGLFFTIIGVIPFREAVAGPVGIYHLTSQVARIGIVPLAHFVGILSVSLGIINLFPLPVLDGGHIFFLGLERVRGRPLSSKWEELITRIGLIILIGLMLVIVCNDILKFIVNT